VVAIHNPRRVHHPGDATVNTARRAAEIRSGRCFGAALLAGRRRESGVLFSGLLLLLCHK
jgi:hypothetical protein